MGMTTNDKLWSKLQERLHSFGYEQLGASGYAELPLTLIFDRGKLMAWKIGEASCWEPAHAAARIAEYREGLTIDRG